ncbi:hypothetical protein ASD56_00015 [Microbacterium sp. Root166]|nr:hypothetical protein ASD56_00015 [Microbacterium sp. Root166]
MADAAAVAAVASAAAARTVVYLVNDPETEPDTAVFEFERVVRATAEHGARRIVLASSAAVYGDGGSSPFREDSPLRGSSPYALAKARSERALTRVGDELGISVLALRIFNVFGRGCAGSLINRLTGGPRPALMLSESFVRDYVDVDDVALAFVAAAGGDTAGVLNVARGVAVDNLELAEAAGPEAFDAVSGRAESYSVGDISRVRSRLSWSARTDPLEVLRARRNG